MLRRLPTQAVAPVVPGIVASEVPVVPGTSTVATRTGSAVFTTTGSGSAMHAVAPTAGALARTSPAVQFDRPRRRVLPPTLPQPEYASLKDFIADYADHRWHETGTLVGFLRHAESLFNEVEVAQGRCTYSPLTKDGREQARRAAQALARLPAPVAGIYSSPMDRAEQTAGSLRDLVLPGAQLNVLPDLNEVETGLLQGWPKGLTSVGVDALLAGFDDPTRRARYRLHHGISDADIDVVAWNIREQRKIIQHIAAYEGITEDELVAKLVKDYNSFDRAAYFGESFVAVKSRARRLKENVLETIGPGFHAFVSHSSYLKVVYMDMLGIDFNDRDKLYGISQKNACINVFWRSKGGGIWRLIVLNEHSHNPRAAEKPDLA